MNIKVIKNSIMFLTIVFSLCLTTGQALAYVPGVWDPQSRIQTGEPAFYKVPTTYDEPIVPQTSSTTVVTNKNVTTTKTVNNTIKKNTTISNTSNITTPADERQLPPVVNTDNNGLTALSLEGSGGFMPSSIWQWFLVILLILAIIIIARMLARKHEHTEIHTVTAH